MMKNAIRLRTSALLPHKEDSDYSLTSRLTSDFQYASSKLLFTSHSWKFEQKHGMLQIFAFVPLLVGFACLYLTN